MRTLITDILASDPEISAIETAKCGSEALLKLEMFRPDCVTLDLVMPGESGLTTLETIMATHPTPVIILSALAKKDATSTFECLAAGAVAFVPKPSGELSLDIETVKTEILETVKAVSQVSRNKLKQSERHGLQKLRHPRISHSKIIVIGASTGGPQSVEKILSLLPEGYPCPILVVQHMPSSFFVESYAERLNKNYPLKVKVIEDQELLEAGTVYLAIPEFNLNFHRRLAQDRYSRESGRNANSVTITLKEEKLDLNSSIDRAMCAVVKLYGSNTVGVILSGIGKDGTEGMKAIRAAQGTTIAQDKDALIFGMPRSAIEAGVVDRVLALEGIAEALNDLVRAKEAKI
ncbi:MAG: response regulator [Elusimicrobia bacterium]|nr:response regulator [Elusimicrobiota bacterium]